MLNYFIIYFVTLFQGSDFTSIRISGYLRGQNLSANQLVHIPGWGTFQMQQIEMPTQDPHPLEIRKRGDEEKMDEDIKILDVADPQNQVRKMHVAAVGLSLYFLSFTQHQYFYFLGKP